MNKPISVLPCFKRLTISSLTNRTISPRPFAMTTSSLPSTVRAVIQPDPQASDLIMSSTPLPKLSSPDEYLIKVKAVSPCLNELTWEANFPHLFSAERYRVPGTECAGVVVDGPANGAFKVGNEIYFRGTPGRTGTLREYTVGYESEMALKPKSLGWSDAAATPLSALTAWQGLFEHGILDKAGIHGDVAAREKNAKARILITGAGGGVGSWAVQFAAAAGAGGIIGVAGPSKASDVLGFGATVFIDYTKQSIEQWTAEDQAAREVDMVLDCVGGDSTKSCWAAIKNDGVFLSIAGVPSAAKPENETKTLAKGEWYLVEPRGSDLAEITQLLDGGKFKPLVDSVFPFEKFTEAFEKVQGGKSKGKVVITVSE